MSVSSQCLLAILPVAQLDFKSFSVALITGHLSESSVFGLFDPSESGLTRQ